ncbi:MAG: hypothetical protein V4502_13205 [Pseudomonadota bacterium]
MSGDRDIVLPPRLQAAKAAFRDLVDAFGGQEATSAETGKSQSRISAYGHRNMGDFPPVDVVARLEASTAGSAGHPHVTRWLARQAGYALVSLPDPSAPSMQWTAIISELTRATGQLSSALLDDLSDGPDIGATAAWRRLKAADDLLRIAVEIDHALRLRASEEE